MVPLSHRMTFAGNPLDRAHLKRMDEAWLAGARADPRARILLLAEGRPLLSGAAGDGADHRTVWLSPEEAGPLEGQETFLGLAGDLPHFARDIGAAPETFAPHGAFLEPRLALFGLPAQ